MNQPNDSTRARPPRIWRATLGSLLLLVLAAAYLTLVSSTGKITARAEATLEELMAPGPLPENAIGSQSAPVTIVEYTSITCSHCAAFHKNVLPGLKQKYIDTGKVRYVLRDFPLDNTAFAASALARCAGAKKYFAFIDALFATLETWHCLDCDIEAGLMKLWKQTGMGEDKFKQCLDPKANKAMLDGINGIRKRGSETFGVNATPAFFVNGKPTFGIVTLEDLEKAIIPLL